MYEKDGINYKYNIQIKNKKSTYNVIYKLLYLIEINAIHIENLYITIEND